MVVCHGMIGEDAHGDDQSYNALCEDIRYYHLGLPGAPLNIRVLWASPEGAICLSPQVYGGGLNSICRLDQRGLVRDVRIIWEGHSGLHVWMGFF